MVEMTNTVSWREMLETITQHLGNAQEARWLCEHASGMDGHEFGAQQNELVTMACAKSLDAMVRARLSGMPLQYVMKRWAFRHLDVMVDERVLIPRPETEQLVQVALDLAITMKTQVPLQIVDLGTGSGVIGLSIAFELGVDAANVWLTDASLDALDVARANMAGIGRAAANVRVAHGSWWQALPNNLASTIDIAICNPPYIAHLDKEVASDVHDYEPHVALYADENGLADLRSVIEGAPDWLKKSGWLVLEIGYQQGAVVNQMLCDSGFSSVAIHQDLAGRDRIAVGQLDR
ncbi:MAG: peptide chain release factor N(5)-glutamine methyltransferase [Actinobacteria bacterium]|nr:MAG: peptide chain release factor N(5)-glutamine methyltransferase [Actinomycetota bacterium]